jgi:hypothetical protein
MKKIIANKTYHFVIALFVISQAFYFSILKIDLLGEAPKYAEEADRFLKAFKFSEVGYWFYSVPIFLNALAKLLNCFPAGTILAQVIISFFATKCLYKLSSYIFKNNFWGLLTASIYLLQYPIQKYNFTPYTESIYSSLLIVLTATIILPSPSKKNKLVAVLLLLFLLVFTRPNGLSLLAVVTYFYAILYYLRGYKWQVATIVFIGFIIFIPAFNYIMASKAEFNFLAIFKNEYIVCGVQPAGLSGKLISLNNSNTIKGIFYYVVNNPLHFLVLSWQKTLSFFSGTRYYFSNMHNLIIGCFLYPLYFFTLFGIGTIYKTSKCFFLFSSLNILAAWLIVIFTCDDWGGRFLVPILFFIIIYAIAGIKKLYSLKKYFLKEPATIS